MARVASTACLAVIVLLAAAVRTLAQAPGQGTNVAAFNDLTSDNLAFRFELPTDAAPRNALLQSTSPALIATSAPPAPPACFDVCMDRVLVPLISKQGHQRSSTCAADALMTGGLTDGSFAGL